MARAAGARARPPRPRRRGPARCRDRSRCSARRGRSTAWPPGCWRAAATGAPSPRWAGPTARCSRRASAVIACNLPLDEARRVAHAKRPTLLLVPSGQDRYAYGALPRVGAENALPALPDGAPDLDGLVARLAAVLRPTTPPRSRPGCRRCRRRVREHGLGGAASAGGDRSRALTRGSRSAGPALTLLQARHALRVRARLRARRRRPGARRRRSPAWSAPASLLRRAGQRARAVSPRLGAAAVAYAGTLAIGTRCRRHGAPRQRRPLRTAPANCTGPDRASVRRTAA